MVIATVELTPLLVAIDLLGHGHGVNLMPVPPVAPGETATDTHAMREPNQLRESVAAKLAVVDVSPRFKAVLACLVGQDWTTPRIAELHVSQGADGCVLARLDGGIGFDTVIGAESDLRRNIRGVAEVAGLDGDETGWLLAQVASLRRVE